MPCIVNDTRSASRGQSKSTVRASVNLRLQLQTWPVEEQVWCFYLQPPPNEKSFMCFIQGILRGPPVRSGSGSGSSGSSCRQDPDFMGLALRERPQIGKVENTRGNAAFCNACLRREPLPEKDSIELGDKKEEGHSTESQKPTEFLDSINPTP